MKITNISHGPRGINTKAGQIVIEKGETVEVEMVDAEKAVSAATGWFSIEDDEPAGDELNRDDLKKQADELGLEYAKNISSAKLKELIDAKLAS